MQWLLFLDAFQNEKDKSTCHLGKAIYVAISQAMAQLETIGSYI